LVDAYISQRSRHLFMSNNFIQFRPRAMLDAQSVGDLKQKN